MSHNARWDLAIQELTALHNSKNEDYATLDDPFKNLRNAEEYGIPSWIGCQIRHDDKGRRIQEFVKKGHLNNEPVRDSLLDQAAYAILALALYDEANDVGPLRRAVEIGQRFRADMESAYGNDDHPDVVGDAGPAEGDAGLPDQEVRGVGR